MNTPRAIPLARISASTAHRLLLSDRVRHTTTQCLLKGIRSATTATTSRLARRNHPAQWRQFSNTPSCQKKGGKAAREEKQAAAKLSDETTSEDPLDLSILEAELNSVLERLRSDLSKLRGGGRFNPEVVENLRVTPDKASNQTVRLNDLAQVVPRGRTVQILVGEKEHVKPVSSAIQASTLSLTPQPDPTGANPLMLVLNIPPPTAESRRAAVDVATKAGERASAGVRDARSRQQKKLRALQTSRAAREDDLNKAKTRMEKVVEKGAGEVKKVVDNAKKVLESG